MLVSITDARLKDVAHSGHVSGAGGFDIRPYSDTSCTTPLTYELERYNASTGEVIMWVKIASLSSSVDTVIYLGYGDSSLTTDGSSTATWSNNFVSVYHLKDGTTFSVSDSTGTNNGTNHLATATTGQIDGAGAFASASSEYVSATPNLLTAFTVSAWVNATSFPNAANGVITTTIFKDIYVKSTGKLACFVSRAGGNSSYDGTGSHTLSTGTWYHLALSFDSSTGLIGYVNAASDGTAASGGGAANNGSDLNIGQDISNANRFWNGKIDEVRLSSVVRSANWITTEYNNQSNPNTFESLGAEVAGCPAATPTSTPSATSTPTPSATFTPTATATATSTPSATFTPTATATITPTATATASSCNGNPASFTTVTDPIGVATSSGKLLVTEQSTQKIDAVDGSGGVTVFATIPGSGSGEKYIAVAPAAAASATPAWTPGTIFYTHGTSVYKVSGGTGTLFATISGCQTDKTGITFDGVGTFGHDMIVTCVNGLIWTVNASGTPTAVGDVANWSESPVVAPSAFGTYGGQILVSDEINGVVHAIDSGGTVTPNVFTWSGAETLRFVPNPVLPFFLASEIGGTIYKYPSTDFIGLSGDLLVSSETSDGISKIHWNGSGYDQCTFDTSLPLAFEGGEFAALSTPTPTPTPTPTATATSTPTPTPTPSPTPAGTGEISHATVQ